MGWTLAIVFAAAIVLLILSFVKTKQSTKSVEQQIDQISFNFNDEIYQLQQKIREIELDAEITAQEAGLKISSPKERLLMRDVLGLHKRGYSFDSIATKTKLTKEEVEELLTPYIKANSERSQVSNGI